MKPYIAETGTKRTSVVITEKYTDTAAILTGIALRMDVELLAKYAYRVMSSDETIAQKGSKTRSIPARWSLQYGLQCRFTYLLRQGIFAGRHREVDVAG